MKRVLPKWSKEAKIELIKRDMSVTELADMIGISRCYVSRVVNGSAYAPEIADRVSKALEIKIPYSENII